MIEGQRRLDENYKEQGVFDATKMQRAYRYRVSVSEVHSPPASDPSVQIIPEAGSLLAQTYLSTGGLVGSDLE